MPRFDEPPYARPPREAPRNDRDNRRPIDPLPPRDRERERERDHYRMDDPMDIPRMDRIDSSRMDPNRMDTRMDTRMDPRPEQRANTGRPVRGDPRDPRAQEVIYRDTETGQIYPGALPPPSRRTPYADDFDDLKPSTRPIIDPGLAPGQPKPPYNEYFVPGDGIDREVIQREICRYLGQDATCRPGKADDGRQGFIVRAYRALTSEMIRSLRESSEKFYAEKERRRRAGRGGDVAYSEVQDNRDYYYEDMEVDDRSPMTRMARDIDPPVHPRAQIPGRHGLPPVTSGYMHEPMYPAYSISSAPPGQHGMQYEPRAYVAGNTPPPPQGGMRPAATGFPPSQPVYPRQTTSSSTPAMTAPVYRDQQPTERINSYPYSADARPRR